MRALNTRDAAFHGLLTDQTHTPFGKKDAVMPKQIAAKIISLLLDEPTRGDLGIVEDFETDPGL